MATSAMPKPMAEQIRKCALPVADGDSHHTDADKDTNHFIEVGSRRQE